MAKESIEISRSIEDRGSPFINQIEPDYLSPYKGEIPAPKFSWTC